MSANTKVLVGVAGAAVVVAICLVQFLDKDAVGLEGDGGGGHGADDGLSGVDEVTTQSADQQTPGESHRGAVDSEGVDHSGPEEVTAEVEESSEEADRNQQLAEDLSAVRNGFFSENPDFVELDRVLGELVKQIEVDADSVKKDEFGVVRGSLNLAETGLSGTFRLEDGGVRVSLSPSGQTGLDLPVFSNEVTFGFDVDGGAPVGVFQAVQAHPNTSDPSLRSKLGDGSAIVGWTGGVGENGLEAHAITIQAVGNGWAIGRDPKGEALDVPGAGGAAMHQWMYLLDTYND